VPLTIHEQDGDNIPDDAHSSGETLIAPQYTTELSEPTAICHRNVHLAGADYIFISTRLMQDKFALAFEFVHQYWPPFCGCGRGAGEFLASWWTGKRWRRCAARPATMRGRAGRVPTARLARSR